MIKEYLQNMFICGRSFKIKLICQSIIVGTFVGFQAVLFRIALEKAKAFRHLVMDAIDKNPEFMVFWMLFLIGAAFIVGYLLKKEPLICGSGIPQVEGLLLGKLEMSWIRVLINKMAGGILAIGSGLSLGREGPSIQLGAAVGQGVGRMFKKMKVEEKYLITSGASAGLAAAFNAPLAGVMFSLEEVHRHFSPLILLSAMSASLTADFISKQFFGLNPVFGFDNIIYMDLSNYGHIIILGIITGFCGVIYNKTLLKTQDLYSKLKWLPQHYRPIIPFVLAGIFIKVLPQVLGGGHGIIESLVHEEYGIKMLFILLIVKFAYSMVSYGSGAPGGIFFPLLVLGAITGAIYNAVLMEAFGLEADYELNYMILAMAGYFTAIVRAPITGIILLTEMIGSLSHLLSLSLVSLAAYVTADLFKSEPIYESLLDRLLVRKNNDNSPKEDMEEIIMEVAVCMDSHMDGKPLRDIELPTDVLILSIKRGNKKVVPRGNTIILSGDILLVNIHGDKKQNEHIKEKLLEMSSKPAI